MLPQLLKNKGSRSLQSKMVSFPLLCSIIISEKMNCQEKNLHFLYFVIYKTIVIIIAKIIKSDIMKLEHKAYFIN